VVKREVDRDVRLEVLAQVLRALEVLRAAPLVVLLVVEVLLAAPLVVPTVVVPLTAGEDLLVVEQDPLALEVTVVALDLPDLALTLSETHEPGRTQRVVVVVVVVGTEMEMGEAFMVAIPFQENETIFKMLVMILILKTSTKFLVIEAQRKWILMLGTKDGRIESSPQLIGLKINLVMTKTQRRTPPS